jgi:hypothetical protein
MDTLFAHIWGKCHPTDCDAGIASGPYQGNPVKLSLNENYATEQFTLSLQGNNLHVITQTHFTDKSGRADQTKKTTSHKLLSFHLPRQHPFHPSLQLKLQLLRQKRSLSVHPGFRIKTG